MTDDIEKYEPFTEIGYTSRASSSASLHSLVVADGVNNIEHMVNGIYRKIDDVVDTVDSIASKVDDVVDTVDTIASKVDDVGDTVYSKFNNLVDKVDSKVDDVVCRIVRKVARLESKIDNTVHKIDGLVYKVDSLSTHWTYSGVLFICGIGIAVSYWGLGRVKDQ
jgi:uncharacterized protein YoxC